MSLKFLLSAFLFNDDIAVVMSQNKNVHQSLSSSSAPSSFFGPSCTCQWNLNPPHTLSKLLLYYVDLKSMLTSSSSRIHYNQAQKTMMRTYNPSYVNERSSNDWCFQFSCIQFVCYANIFRFNLKYLIKLVKIHTNHIIKFD